METATVIREGDLQTIRLPKGFHFSTPTVSVRHDGEAIVLEPMKARAWPERFFEGIHISDPAFVRPARGIAARATAVVFARDLSARYRYLHRRAAAKAGHG